ncbi:MAG TPA: hypothetical protein DCE56_14050 [Cyanobacteria bacterium UBA8553]|nr:hypothetical protein [Cyanobacteria bacterium UBA8553]
MIESLRRWGGQFANAPILAVTPRLGPPLARKTHQFFDEFHVQYIRSHQQSKYSWFPYLNKPLCLTIAEKHSTCEQMIYLDADLLIVGEPDKLILNNEEDFLACTPDQIGGTTGPEDPLEPFWKEACSLVGLDIKDLPWVKTELEGARIRLYWNGGVFAYRRSTGFAQQYLQTTIKMLESNIVSQVCGIFFHEQIAMALAVAKMGINWRGLPHSHNYAMSSLTHDEFYNEEQLKTARIIHYHDAMWPTFWAEFIKCMADTHPQVADWLTPLGPMKNEAPSHWRVTNQLLKQLRSRQESEYRKFCRVN